MRDILKAVRKNELSVNDAILQIESKTITNEEHQRLLGIVNRRHSKKMKSTVNNLIELLKNYNI